MNMSTIEIEVLFEIHSDGDYGDPLWLYCKGHVSVEEFMRGVRERNEYQGEDYEIQPYDIHQDYARNIPLGPEHKGKGQYSVQLCKLGRGAYPITYVDVS